MHMDKYTPGYGAPMVSFLSERKAEVHAGFFLPQLRPGWHILDAGCGPGSITLGLARAVQPGRVTGIDVEDSQFSSARERAEREGLNVEFRTASVYELPFSDGSFDAVFSHAMLEHLAEPVAALRELRRILRPGGVIGVRAADLGGTLLDAASDGPAQAFQAYLTIQKNDSKDPKTGRKLARLIRQAGFTVKGMTASYEVITETLLKIGPSLAQHLALSSFSGPVEQGEDQWLFVALAWCEAIGLIEPVSWQVRTCL